MRRISVTLANLTPQKNSMVDIRTLIFSVALGNLAFALMVWVYSRSSEYRNPCLGLWQLAKLVTGIGFLIGWMRPLLPVELQIYAQIGNAMQFIGVGIELAAYSAFLGVQDWRRRVGLPIMLGVAVFALAVGFGASQHITIAIGTCFGGAAYLAMGLLMLRQTQKDRLLTRVLGSFDIVLSVLLLTKLAMAVMGVQLVPYATNGINEALYTLGFVVLMNNGFGFLLLTKQDDDRNQRRLMAELSAADTNQRHFIAMLSHEVRAPVAVISATTQLLAVHLRHQVQHAPLLQRIQRGVARLTFFFDNCLTQDRVFSQHYRLTPVQVDITALVLTARESAEAFSEQHQLKFDLPDTPVVVSGDAVLLRIAVMNLLSNAIKFSPSDSVVTLRVRHDAAHCRVEVQDKGPGVPEADRELIFEKYWRGATAERTPGAGLGLAIVQSIVSLHKGSLSVEPAPAGGALFVVEIPSLTVSPSEMQ